jgi:hypothetical protein
MGVAPVAKSVASIGPPSVGAAELVRPPATAVSVPSAASFPSSRASVVPAAGNSLSTVAVAGLGQTDVMPSTASAAVVGVLD